MTIVLGTPDVAELDEAVAALREWQHDGAPLQLHPGDLGWAWKLGAEATAATVRTWRRGERIVAVGLLDTPDLLRMTVAPDAHQDEELARRVVEDVTDPARGVLPAGKAYVETPTGILVRDRLSEAGWKDDEPWVPLSWDLTEPVKDPGVRIEVIGPEQAEVPAALVRASFERSKFSAEAWRAVAAGTPFADARCLVAYDEQDNAVATVTVWSAGPGRPGLIEPMGVHRDHRGHGYGRAITIAAAAALREMGSSSAQVCTLASLVAAVATYESAGFRRLPERRDVFRDA